MKRKRAGAAVVFASALLPVVAGVAVANTLPQVQEKITGDGHHLKLSIEGVDIESVPNMAAAPFVREGYVNATARLEFKCEEGNTKCEQVPVTAQLKMKTQVGCPLDLSGGIQASADPNVGASLPVGAILGAILPPPTPAPTPGATDLTNIALSPLANIQPQISANLAPGTIRETSLGSMTFPVGDPSFYEQLRTSLDLAGKARTLNQPPPKADPTASPPPPLSPTENAITKRAADLVRDAVLSNQGQRPLVVSVQKAHLVVDASKNGLGACGGVVAVRIYAKATVQTPTATDTLETYGDIFTL